MEDEMALLESLERRAAGARWKSALWQARLARLPKLRECLAAITKLFESVRHLETEALGMLYQRETLDRALITQELDAFEQNRRKLAREVFRAQQEMPDEVVLAFYSEHRGMLLEFAAAYWKLAEELGEAVACDYLVPPAGGRSSATRLTRETPKKLSECFNSPPEKAVGIVMHLRGDLFYPQFCAEAGLHTIREKQRERSCLIEAAPPPFDKYEPPKAIERAGAIEQKGAPLCRLFDYDKHQVQDSLLGESPFKALGILRRLATLVEKRLDKMIERMTA
jgi:hypothetical protein